jgi:hypothetical protein
MNDENIWAGESRLVMAMESIRKNAGSRPDLGLFNPKVTQRIGKSFSDCSMAPRKNPYMAKRLRVRLGKLTRSRGLGKKLRHNQKSLPLETGKNRLCLSLILWYDVLS